MVSLLENKIGNDEGISSDVISPSPESFGVGVSISIDVMQVIDAVARAIGDKADREAFVKSLLDQLASMTNGQANIMIFNREQNCEFNPDYNRTSYGQSVFNGIIYGAWVFCGGERFVNQGDGGWINWGFYGSFDREGNTVQFRERSDCQKS